MVLSAQKAFLNKTVPKASCWQEVTGISKQHGGVVSSQSQGMGVWGGRCRLHLPHALWWLPLASLGAYRLPTHTAGLNYARNLFNCLTWFKTSREIQVIISSCRNFLQNGWGDSKIRNIATLGSFLKCIYFYFLPETNELLAKSVPKMMKSKRRQGAECTRK